MKALKIFSIAAPITACAYYYIGTHRRPLSFTNLNAANQQMKLEQVQIVFRHGARTPIFFHSKDFENFSNIDLVEWDENKWMNILPWTDIDFTVKFQDGSIPPCDTARNQQEKLVGGCSRGELTCVGQQQLYELGKQLHNEYVTKKAFLSPIYEKNEVYVRSTNFPRTIQSAVCLLAGFYGNDTFTEPVLIETNKRTEEHLSASRGCALVVKWLKNFRGEIVSTDIKEEEETLNLLMGKNEDTNCKDMISIFDLLDCREAHELDIPQYLLDKKEVIHKYAIQVFAAKFGFGNPGITRMMIGAFVETVCCRINEAIAGSNQTKMLLYSAHDGTIVRILLAFGVDVKEWPPFASTIIIELYKRDDGERFIRVLYNGEPLMLGEDENEEYLHVGKFMKLVEMYRVLDWHKECGNDVNK